MRSARCIVSLILSCACLGLGFAEPGEALITGQTAEGEIAGWKSFSEGGAQTGSVWRLGENGVLVCQGNPNGYLYTEKAFADFTLTLEWRWPPGGKAGKGGVLIRMTGAHQIWPCSLEAQLNAGAAGDFWALGGFALAGPGERLKALDHPRFGHLRNLPRQGGAEKPVGEWNTMEVTATGDKVVIVVNGEVVNRAEGCAAGPGAILLTSEGSEIHFRNLRLSAAK